ncbi:ATP-grasp domain-containing protein [Oceanibaculum pacificum]|uniref:Alpha-L-glutamate ligase n=1 Tax=Oceanibaculum pacificum TaxID=580166 RepID=A0A154WF99_9PROT|nr:alpha-L-glutamate ligase [Oceanibaculum pacificum]KZD12182.1 alpha-L-glutamate ligase [Oceanibaculum pacificum]
MAHIHILYENADWLAPLAETFDARGLPWHGWDMADGAFDISAPPPDGVFFSRMSASAHTRDHRFSTDLTAGVLTWLERHGRYVVNGVRALDLELSKARQYAALEKAGIRTPRTLIVLGRHRLLEAAQQAFGDGPFILKPNRGGKGLGVQLFNSLNGLQAYIESPLYDEPVDGIHLLQQYVKAPEPYIIRAEFIGGRFLYAVRVDTSDGFELCPADACPIGDAFCPVGEEAARPKFEIIPGIDPAQKAAYERLLEAAGIDVAGIEYVLDAEGVAFTYDVNTNTNYNTDAEAKAGISGRATLADFLGGALARLYPPQAAE